jgi:hypothetical protein
VQNLRTIRNQDHYLRNGELTSIESMRVSHDCKLIFISECVLILSSQESISCRLWESSLQLQCDMILKHQPHFKIQLSNFSRNSSDFVEGTGERTPLPSSKISKEQSTEGRVEEEVSEGSDVDGDCNLDSLLAPHELRNDDATNDISNHRHEPDDFSDQDSILEPLGGDAYHRSNEFSSYVMLLSRTIFKLTSDHIFSFYERYLLEHIAVPFLDSIKDIKHALETNPQVLQATNTSELSSEVREMMLPPPAVSPLASLTLHLLAEGRIDGSLRSHFLHFVAQPKEELSHLFQILLSNHFSLWYAAPSSAHSSSNGQQLKKMNTRAHPIRVLFDQD